VDCARARILLIPAPIPVVVTHHRELSCSKMVTAPGLPCRHAGHGLLLGRDQSLIDREGQFADFMLLPGDPTSDLKAIKRIRMVVGMARWLPGRDPSFRLAIRRCVIADSLARSA
jgi:hypothetical protein